MLGDSSFGSSSSQERVECLQRPCGRPGASRKHRLHNLSKFHNSAISRRLLKEINEAKFAVLAGYNGTFGDSCRVGRVFEAHRSPWVCRWWASKTRPTLR